MPPTVFVKLSFVLVHTQHDYHNYTIYLYITENFCVTRVHNMSKELKFSLVKSFISKPISVDSV